MSSAQTQTGGSEAKNIGLPTHARQKKNAQGNPCASYRVEKQTVLATPNPLPAEQAKIVSSSKRGHQQLGGRTTWWSALAKLAAKLLSVSHTAAKADFVALDCLRTMPTVQIRHPNGLKVVLREDRSCCCNFRKRHVFADLLKDFRQIPSSAASQRHICP